MKIKLKNIGLLIFSVFIALGYNNSTAKELKNEKKSLIKELRDEINSYTDKKIIPEMKEWKEILDKALSKEDLAKLNELRAKASALKEEVKRERIKILEESKNEDWEKDETKDKLKDEKKEFKSEMKDIAIELKPLAEKYKDVLIKIGEQAKPQKENWENGILQIINNWKNEHKEELEQLKNNKKIDRNIMKQSDLIGLADMDGDKKRAVARFMLWDGKYSNNENSSRNEKSIKTKRMTGENNSDLRAYPNPFNEKTTIYFNLSRQDIINLAIYDETGNKITVLFEGELGNGEHSFVFNTKNYKNLASGTYTYKLVTSTETKSGRMVFTK